MMKSIAPIVVLLVISLIGCNSDTDGLQETGLFIDDQGQQYTSNDGTMKPFMAPTLDVRQAVADDLIGESIKSTFYWPEMTLWTVEAKSAEGDAFGLAERACNVIRQHGALADPTFVHVNAPTVQMVGGAVLAKINCNKEFGPQRDTYVRFVEEQTRLAEDAVDRAKAEEESRRSQALHDSEQRAHQQRQAHDQQLTEQTDLCAQIRRSGTDNPNYLRLQGCQ